MKTANLLIFFVSLLLLAFAPPGCAIPSAENRASLEAAALAWPAVYEDVHRGIETGVSEAIIPEESAQALRDNASEIERALKGKKVEPLVYGLWPTLRPWGEVGIQAKLDAGEIGAGVSNSLTEQLDLFTETMGRLSAAKD